MALILHLKYVENLRGRESRLCKVSFRGMCHYTKIVENSDETALFDETFEWPVARPVEPEEIIDIQVYNYNKYLSNRLIGTFRMILQELIEVGSVKISDSLLDANNVVMKTTITFELTYNAPDGSVGHWQKGGFEKLTSDDLRRPLSEDERNKLSLDRSSALGDSESVLTDTMKSQSRLSINSARSSGGRSPISTGKSPLGAKKLTSVVKMVMKKEKIEEDIQNLLEEEDLDSNILDAKAAEVASMMAATAQRTIEEDQASDSQITSSPIIANRRKKQKASIDTISLNKSQDFQVCVTVIEARQLAGLNMDPVVCVQVGDNKKFTSVKESTNCPYYNEACQSGRLLRSNKALGSYKLDVSTVYAQPDHQFYHKWAMLTDPDDLGGGVKGYLKCDISVIGKGDSVKVPPKTDKDEDDIEGNLLLPEGVPADRQRAKFYVKIYKAEGLPKMNAGLVANVKKAFTGESNDLVDPYVEVLFAGQRGRTSVKRGSYEPVWNEQIVFTEMFPPLCRRFRVQLRDKDSVNDHIIGTHFIDLSQISNEGEKGFLPTFGPCWVNLYGSTRYYQFLDEHTHLNDGLGEGVSYRGRIQVAIKTEILDSSDSGPATVEVESTLPVGDNAAGRPEEYFLFGCFMEATMIDKKMADKSLHFEISIGNAGNVLDGYNSPTKDSKESSSEDEAASVSDTEETVEPGLSFSANIPKWNSTTGATRPVTKDKIYYHMPFYADKPCVYVKEQFEDHRRRLYNSNIIEKIIEKLDDGLSEVHDMIRQEIPFPERRLRGVFEELGHGCSRFVSLVKGSGGGAAAGKTKLDKERHKILIREMDQLSTIARTVKATITKNNLKDKMRSGQNCLNKLRRLQDEPQPSLPDVYIWMITAKKRIAYQRISARDIIYSVVEEEKGKDCGKVVTLLLKLPGKKASGESGWTIQAKLQVYIWLGLLKHKKDYLKGLPAGYEETKALKHSTKTQAVPPPFIFFNEKQTFQLRAHMYQARQLIGSDASGLSDPFARIAFSEQSVSTQVIEETLSPTWDEFLILNEVDVYGLIEEIVENPPTIIVEVFDQDVGKSEFIGRCLCKPIVKQCIEKYEPPKFPPRLEWWDITRGSDRAGELLAAFELLQYPFEERDLKSAYMTPPYARKSYKISLLAPFGDRSGAELPPMELPDLEKDRGPIMPVPKGIRPILSTHRIEVLFWGVRDIKRVQLQSVDHPRIDIECAGHVLQSAVILNCKKNPNFSIPVKFFDVELPENEHYCPPITIRCVDCRSFGRYVLVGTHVISNIHKFMFIPTTKKAKAALTKLFPGNVGTKFMQVAQQTQISKKSEDVAITMDENLPLINKEQYITVDTGDFSFHYQIDKKDGKASEKNKKKKKKDGSEEDAPDLESMDWWSKYFASVETMIREPGECSEQRGQENFESGAGSKVASIAEVHHQEKAPLSPREIYLREHEKDNEGYQDDYDMDKNQQTKVQTQQSNTPYGSIPNGNDSTNNDEEPNSKEAKKMEKELKRLEKKDQGEKKPVKGTTKASTLAKQLSPKSQRKKEKILNNTAQLKFHDLLKKASKNDELRTLDTRAEKGPIPTIKVYPNELESQNEFEGFKDWLHTFELYRGKKSSVDESDDGRIVGKFKGSLKIYKIPLPPDLEDTTVTGGDPQYGLFQGLPSNDPIKVLVRVYVVKANDLHPADINGKADPYLVIRLGNTTVNDKDNYISKQLNPVFGKCFEIEATFPMESLLTIQIYDWDLVGMDDLIGETKLDLENRYYSRHRATCGLAKKYEIHGYNAWRDPLKPCHILAKLCKDSKVDGPYYQPGKVRVGNRIFTAATEVEDENDKTKKKNMFSRKRAEKEKEPLSPDEQERLYSIKKSTDEHLALAALNHWEEIPKVGCKLVPEHVETRPLYHPEKVGIEQGKVELWVDMFPMDMPAPAPPVDISPRKPKSYELRCIIWNTDDVVLEDDAFFSGEKMSDIYVKGWIKGPEDMQSTDIHYRSLTGEGNFNWRFIFPFDYLVAEEKIVISRKETLFSWDETESKIPARLNLQVWDADHFSADDFLGSLTLDLNRFPRGAKSSKLCTLDMLKTDGTVPQMSLFKHKRVKGWWPFAVKNQETNDELELTGKVEAELQLITADEAEKHPAGQGRNEPDPLDKPNRPDSSFMWFMNPWKSIRYILWHNYKWVILKLLIVILLTAVILLFFYSMPGYTVKKLFGA